MNRGAIGGARVVACRTALLSRRCPFLYDHFLRLLGLQLRAVGQIAKLEDRAGFRSTFGGDVERLRLYGVVPDSECRAGGQKDLEAAVFSRRCTAQFSIPVVGEVLHRHFDGQIANRLSVVVDDASPSDGARLKRHGYCIARRNYYHLADFPFGMDEDHIPLVVRSQADDLNGGIGQRLLQVWRESTSEHTDAFDGLTAHVDDFDSSSQSARELKIMAGCFVRLRDVNYRQYVVARDRPRMVCIDASIGFHQMLRGGFLIEAYVPCAPRRVRQCPREFRGQELRARGMNRPPPYGSDRSACDP